MEDMGRIDIVTTATIRPKLLEKTYSSFTSKLLKPVDRFHLIINIDPIGESKYAVDDVIVVAKNYFKDITINTPKEPNLSKAVIWCWKNIVSDFVFFLEDDWKLNKEVDINILLGLLKKNPGLASIGLNQLEKEKMVKELVPGEWKSTAALARKFAYLIRISLNPVLIRGEYLRAVVPHMWKNYKPESQLRQPAHPEMKKIKSLWKFVSYVGLGFEPVMEDIGRVWMQKSKWKRAKKGRFLYWEHLEKNNENNTH